MSKNYPQVTTVFAWSEGPTRGDTETRITPTLYSSQGDPLQRFAGRTFHDRTKWTWTVCSQPLGGFLPNYRSSTPFQTPCHYWDAGYQFGALVERKYDAARGGKVYMGTSTGQEFIQK
jgi:hypothetical protein